MAGKASVSEGQGVQRWRTHLLLSLLSAVLLSLAYPPVGWGWAAHLALAPIAALALRTGHARRLVWSTYLVGTAWWLIMIGWLAGVTGGGYVALCLFLALYTPATLSVYRLLVRQWQMPSMFALPLAWVTFEFIRGHAPAGGFGWFSLAHSHGSYEPGQHLSRIVQTADLFGEHGVSFLIAMTNGLIVDLLTRPIAMLDRHGRPSYRPAISLLAVWLAFLGGAWAYGEYRIRTASPSGLSFNVAVVQTDVPQNNKIAPEPGAAERDWQDMLKLVRDASALQPRPDVIVCPETMVPAAINDDAVAYYRRAETRERGMESYRGEIQALADELKTPLIVGAPAKYDWRPVPDPLGGPDVYILPSVRTNAVFLIRPGSSAPLQQYDKMHLVPFGEYIPWVAGWPEMKRLFIRHLSPYPFDYTLTPGREAAVFMVGETRIATPICFEDAIGRVVRNMAYNRDGFKRVDMLVNLTNDGWYPGSAQGWQHVQISSLRCVELRLPMARSVNTGVSGFIDSSGRVIRLVESAAGEHQEMEGVAVQQLTGDARATLFGRLGEMPVMLLVVVTVVLVIIGLALRR